VSHSLAALPGGALVAQGITDLGSGSETIEALVVSIGHPRLTALGLALPPPLDEPEHRLYQALSASEPDAAHGRYNALVRQLVSFERAFACAA
jgi:hypothetical protein